MRDWLCLRLARGRRPTAEHVLAVQTNHIGPLRASNFREQNALWRARSYSRPVYALGVQPSRIEGTIALMDVGKGCVSQHGEPSKARRSAAPHQRPLAQPKQQLAPRFPSATRVATEGLLAAQHGLSLDGNVSGRRP